MDYEQLKQWAYEDARVLIKFLIEENQRLRKMLRDKDNDKS